MAGKNIGQYELPRTSYLCPLGTQPLNILWIHPQTSNLVTVRKNISIFVKKFCASETVRTTAYFVPKGHKYGVQVWYLIPLHSLVHTDTCTAYKVRGIEVPIGSLIPYTCTPYLCPLGTKYE